ncbi:S49 family peptidase [Celeribacter litoreus]|uniref:S49 family peptidase n=1 Tax=Celeribacter litoreus TaxID=2876714 RepID=UPI001CCBE15F|nr:S49 family peptidase [Celeribacter litoreus]MCA0044286.1 S49 family peptidase [Celeribacter litoreus]
MSLRIPFRNSPPRVNVIRLNGAIMTRQGSLNDQSLAPTIEKAFRKGKPAAVALSINSPGGSPVQSSLIAARIKRLAEEKDLPVFAFVEDVAASGGYWLACAAEKIYVDQSSIVGSIGVISAGFGLDEFIAKHGIQRRVYTSGKSKSQLDPFSPENPEDVVRIKGLQEEIHKSFINHVTASRGDRLTQDIELFDGAFWTGATGVDLGLADEIGHLVPTMKDIYGDKVRFSVYGPKKSLFKRFGAELATGLTGHVEEQALWARFGL